MHALDDMALLREYAANGSEAAFGELVSRRAGFVYSTALRQVRDPHLAEEITQAVFVILARKAPHLSGKTDLSGWLFKTTRFVILADLRDRSRRRRREQEAQMRTDLTAGTDEAWEQISPLLDEALARLGEKDRQAILLRFFENKSLTDVGVSLGSTENAAGRRISRALEKLRQRFSRHGIRSSTETIAGAIATHAIQPVPAALVKSATVLGLAKGTALTASTAAIITGALKFMTWTKAQTTAAIAAAVVLTAGVTTVLVKEIITPPLTLKEASVTLYEDPGYGGQSLTLFPPTAATNVAGQRGDIRDFVDASPDGAPGDFNDKTSSATYLLPKGWSVVFFEDADYKAAQYKLVGTGKPEAIPDFSAVAPALDNKISSVRWVRE